MRKRLCSRALAVLLLMSMFVAIFAGLSFPAKAETDSAAQTAATQGPVALAAETWDFESDDQAADFSFYQSGTSSISIVDGMPLILSPVNPG